MTSPKTSSALDGSRGAESSSSNIHNLLNPIQPNSSGGVSQQGSDAHQHSLCCSPCVNLSQLSQIPIPQAPALHAASLDQISSPETVKAQQHSSATSRGEVDTIEPPMSASSIKSRMSSTETLPPVRSHNASWYTSHSSSGHTSHPSTTPRYGLAAPQQSTTTDQASTHSTSVPQPFAALDVSYRGPAGSLAQSSYNLLTPNGLIQVPVDLQSGSRLSDQKRERNAGASARFRERRKQKEHEMARTIAELQRRNQSLMKICEGYREERDHLYNVVARSGLDHRMGRPANTIFSFL